MEQNYAAARQALEEALQKSPENTEALSLVVQSYEAQKQLPAAVQWLREYAERRPKSAPVQFYLAQLLIKSGDTGSARTALAAAKAADSKLTAADLILAQLDLRDGKLDEARKTVSAMISEKPADVPARLLLGNVEQTARNYQAAIEQYRKAVELDEGNVEALNDLAYALAEFGKQPDEALKFAQKAGELAPDDATVADTLGWVLYRKALYTSAIPYLEQAATRQPTGLRKCHLALAYIKSGNQTKGQQMLAAALQMDPSLSHSELFQEVAVSQNASR
jgi:tetratricopeptide (TPR) repeat protein